MQSLLSLPLPAEGSTAPTLWPMPLPFPDKFAKYMPAPEQAPFPVRALQKMLNLVIAALSWLHMGRPLKAPSVMALGRALTAPQWQVVRRLERLLVEVYRHKKVSSADMGRNAVKVEGLDGLLHELHEVAAELPKVPYSDRAAKTGRADSFLLPGHDLGSPGEELGRFAKAAPVLAKKVEASRLSFPEDKPEFDPTRLFDERHSTVYSDPISLAREPEAGDEPPPRVRVQASDAGAFELFRFLDKHHRLRLVPASRVRKERTCGAFSLVKDEQKDRLIVDARPANSLEETLRDYCHTLGAVSALLQVELQPGKQLVMSGTDLRDFYYCFRVSKARSHRNAFKFPLSRAQASQFACFPTAGPDDDIWYPCLATMAMGDNNAVELGQGAHVLLGLNAGIFHPEELLTTHSRAPGGPLSCGIIIDDILFAEQVLGELGPERFTEGERRLELMCEQYLQEGLTAHPGKTFRQALQAQFWGVSVDGVKGTVQAAPKRVIPLVELTLRTARSGVATVGLLEILAGSWVSILQCRKRLMCLLDEIYLAQQGRASDMLIRLSPSLMDELWLLALLGPLAVTDLRAQSIEKIFLTDASEDLKAAVFTEVSQEFARELHRHALARGTWSKLLTPWKLWCKMHGQLFPEDELPEGVPLVSHPLWLALAECLQFSLHQRKEVRRRRHINLLELESILELEERLAKRYADVRYLLGSDSQVALAAILKGRSSSPRLNRVLQKGLATVIGAGLYGSYGYVPSLANVGDESGSL
eukprot:s82_g4.t1